MIAAPATGQVTSLETPLAMICGGGSLPIAVAEYVASRGRQVLLFPLYGAAEGSPVERFTHHWIHIGQVGKFLRTARAAGCSDLVLIGSLVRPSIWRVRPDLKGLSFITRTIAAYRGGDNHLLSGMGKMMEEEGFRLLGAHEVAPEILMPEGVLGSAQPSERDRADIALGLQYLRAAGPFDVGQAVVVAGKHVLAVEAVEGTDQMLARVAELRANGRLQGATGIGVLVKAPKPGQDLRYDMPSIGPRTVEAVAQAGLAGIAVVAGGSIVAEAEKLIAAADSAKIFVVGTAAGS
ncbi:MAG: UDP-2,3-diacylglucosamine diphosphatase LpxI [Pseudolabrys sp.]